MYFIVSVKTNISNIWRAYILKSYQSCNAEHSAYHLYMKMNISAEFLICISVQLIESTEIIKFLKYCVYQSLRNRKRSQNCNRFQPNPENFMNYWRKYFSLSLRTICQIRVVSYPHFPLSGQNSRFSPYSGKYMSEKTVSCIPCVFFCNASS